MAAMRGDNRQREGFSELCSKHGLIMGPEGHKLTKERIVKAAGIKETILHGSITAEHKDKNITPYTFEISRLLKLRIETGKHQGEH